MKTKLKPSWLLVICLGLFSFACAKKEQVRGYNIFTDMAYSPAYKASTANEVTRDGKTMIEPVEGTIARGKMPHLYGQTEDEAERAGRELRSPHSVTRARIDRGEYLYQDYCASCHGVDAKGNGKVVQKGFPAAPSLREGRVTDFAAGRIYHVITAGYGIMPSHGVQMTIADRWDVAHYVKSLHK